MSTPQTALELVNGQIGWALKNISNNLDFIPDDKLNWKPAPEANSVLEILRHATGVVQFMASTLKGETPGELPSITDRESAKQVLGQVVQEHLAVINAMTNEQMEETVALPFGEFPKSFVAALPVVELINHHGQITYIQTMLGDTESHLSL